MNAPTKLVECENCDGVGRYEEQFEPIPGIDYRMGESVRAMMRCRACNGSGEVRKLMTEEEIEQEIEQERLERMRREAAVIR